MWFGVLLKPKTEEPRIYIHETPADSYYNKPLGAPAYYFSSKPCWCVDFDFDSIDVMLNTAVLVLSR